MDFGLSESELYGSTSYNYREELELACEMDIDCVNISSDPPELLGNVDYTLNSPLIADEIREFILYIQGSSYDSIHQKKIWADRRDWLQAHMMKDKGLKGPKEYHAWVGKIFQSYTNGTRDFQSFLSQIDSDAEETFEVLRSFIFGWLKKDVFYSSRTKVKSATFHFGSLMLEFYKMTLMMNASTEKEGVALAKSSGAVVERPPGKKYNLFSYNSSIFGKVKIGLGVAFFEKDFLIMDRNMLLMMKDTAIARFQTLLSIEFKTNPAYEKEHYSNICKMYSYGDLLLIKYGTEAYQGFKLLEPMCSLKISEIAGKFRPLIPVFPHFRNHVDKSIQEIGETMPEFMEFAQHVINMSDLDTLLTAYGSFRHWGHPFINYLIGLEKLFQNTNMDKSIDPTYAESLASDLAYKVLRKEFLEKKKWFVDVTKLRDDHKFRELIINHEWPTKNQILDFGDNWHNLPLTACFEIPECLDPSIIYSDKSHSMNYSEIVDFLKSGIQGSIPSRKVLETFLKRESTDWPKFLQKLNDEGLEQDKLAIGLKGKEREIKEDGRFFALMSWELREYFVCTEYLIKNKYIPLFEGLTMADDQTTLIKKMLKCSAGQGLNEYNQIAIANHIDYSKWNNHQRGEANNPVFRVMGEFFGLPKLFERTHEFFEKSFIYYKDRPDLMVVGPEGVIDNRTNTRVCWQGQKGGLEGLRQKGWSVTNLLAIERESKVRNTRVLTLAQGDNQVIITKYKLRASRKEEDIKIHIDETLTNNRLIMRNIEAGTTKLGLIINNDETLQSAEMLVYGKVIVFRGNILGLDEKRYSRISCTTNDQLPTLGNMLATVSTNCLTVAHYSRSPIDAMLQYNWLGNFARVLMEFHNPALRTDVKSSIDKKYLKCFQSLGYKIAYLYLDPSLGGIGGMSLARFLIRRFPDPVTESLSFWKLIYDNTKEQSVKDLCAHFGNPRLLNYSSKHFCKLLEDPTSLNLPRGISAVTMLKIEIRKGLLKNLFNVKNHIMREALSTARDEEESFTDFLCGINPCFPRFLSEFKAATFLGLADSLIGLFENSKTIRNVFKRDMTVKVDDTIRKSEYCSIQTLLSPALKLKGSMWNCSSTQADILRSNSWSRVVLGSTIPHPLELINHFTSSTRSCDICCQIDLSRNYVSVAIPHGIIFPRNSAGRFDPYLGSDTSESTSLAQPWEKESKISLIRKAVALRSVITWFVERDSNLGLTIIRNLESLTGEAAGGLTQGFKRTGSALHRFDCARQSAGGYISTSPINATRMTISTDSLSGLGDDNYDFMHQSLMLYAQLTAGELHGDNSGGSSWHFHLTCLNCVRPITDPILESVVTYNFKSNSDMLSNWKPPGSVWFKDKGTFNIEVGDWSAVSPRLQSYHIGRVQGFFGAEYISSGKKAKSLESLFPLTLRGKLFPGEFLEGIVDGIYRATCCTLIHRRTIYHSMSHWATLEGHFLWSSDQLCMEAGFINLLRDPIIEDELDSIPHRIPPSYPTTKMDMGSKARSYFQFKFKQLLKNKSVYTPKDNIMWIHGDFASMEMGGLFVLSNTLAKRFIRYSLDAAGKNALREFASISTSIRTGDFNISGVGPHWLRKVKLCDQEIRHCAREIKEFVREIGRREPEKKFGREIVGSVTKYEVISDVTSVPKVKTYVPKFQNPLISGLRIPQLATGSHLKLGAILNDIKISPRDAICGGDGSAGVGAKILRMFPTTRLIFNSYFDISGVGLKGTKPSPPSAIAQMNLHTRSRCVNLNDSWENSSDLSEEATWIYWMNVIGKFNLDIDLIILDMDVKSDEMMQNIEHWIAKYGPLILSKQGVLIVKTYVHRVLNMENNLLDRLCPLFKKLVLYQTIFSSSQTSELYCVAKDISMNNPHMKYIDYISLSRNLSDAYCFKSYHEEHARGILVRNMNTCLGVPALFIPDPIVELKQLVLSLGVESGVISNLAGLLEGILILKPLNGVFLTMSIIASSLLPTTRGSLNPFPIPSDTNFVNLVSANLACMLWISIYTVNSHLGARVQKLLNEGIIINYTRYNKMAGKGYRSFFKWSYTVDHPSHKGIYIDHKMALLGSLIRIFSKMYVNDIVTFDKRLFDITLNQLNKGLTLDVLKRSTGLFEILDMNFRGLDKPFTGLILPDDENDVGYCN